MNRFKLNLKRRYSKSKLLSVLVMMLLGGFAIVYTIAAVSSWFDNNTIVRHDIVVFEFEVNKPFSVEKRRRVPAVVVVEKNPEELEEVINEFEGEKRDIAEYICEKWGVAHCGTAIAVAKAESGLREDAMNVNTNGTVDFGAFQINSVHTEKEGCSLKELVDAYKNVDCAYQIWLSHGKSFNPWVAYWNKSYLAHL